METIKLSNFDRFVYLRQLFKLEQISKINKKLLEKSVIQNKQLESINKQLAEATSINKTILENQLNEIKEKEIQKYYKHLIFNVESVLPQLDSLTNSQIKVYFIANFKSKFNILIDDCINNLSEIADKSFCKNLQHIIMFLWKNHMKFLKK